MDQKKTWIGIGTVLTLIIITLAYLSPLNQRLFEPTSILPDGSVYRGAFKDGRFHGEGELHWSNGDHYIGEFSDGLMQGRGTLTYKTGDVYTGEFNAGYPSGKGEYIISTGATYSGQFKNGLFHGTGSYNMVNGDSYTGEFRADLLHGEGTYTSADGREFKGDFKEDIFTGSGSMSFGDGSSYTGEFKNWEPDGVGVWTLDKEIYEGVFRQGELVGTGTHISSDGDKYTGEFTGWNYNGQGELIKRSGERYVGQFQYGQMHGQGTLFTTGEKGEKITKSGEWRYGSFLEDEKRERDQRTARVEKVLYTQKQNLEEHLNQLKFTDHNLIDLYFLGVAGYGQQEVFRKEVTFIQEQFKERFGIEGRSLLLVNSEDESVDYPLATVTSLERAIKTMEDRMDVDKDILFLYMTSHGSDKDGLVLSYSGMSLPDLSAGKLAEILESTSIKYKVILVSSCYSGMFIEPLKNNQTLIITAADKDRKSFGCSDESDITDFARAYFEKSLPTSSTFEEAFKKARIIVEAEEKIKKVKQHSSPQMVMGEAIRTQLAKWRVQNGY